MTSLLSTSNSMQSTKPYSTNSSSSNGSKLPSSNHIENVEIFCDPQLPQNGFFNMEEIYRLEKLCDITLISNEKKFKAHRIVLASTIPYFHAMFLNDMVEVNQDTITINCIDNYCLEKFIKYAYTGKMKITNENVQSILIGANFFHLVSVKQACCDFIKKRLTINDALAVRSFAEQLMCNDLVINVNRFINRNFNKIIQTKEFLNLNFSDLADLLNRDELNVECEEHVYEALLKWIRNDEKNNMKHLYELLKLIRLPLIMPIYLVEKISNETLIKNNLKSRDLLDEAIFYHLLPDKRVQFKSFNLKPRCCNDSFGFIYAIGCLNAAGGSVATVEVYDCISDKWKPCESMTTTRSRVAVAVLQGKLYAIGGYNGLERLSTVEVFDSETKKWQKVSSISKPRSALGSAVLNNKLYVCGGYDGFQSSDTVEVYDPKSDKWSLICSMKKHRSASGITAFNSMIYAAGGHDGYRIFDSVEAYDTQSNTWSFCASMKTKRCRLGLSGLNGKLYAAGGYDSANFLNSVECYDPIEDKWEYCASMNVKRSRMALITCNGKLYAIGGYDGISNLCSVEVYDPEKDQWTMCSSMISHEGVVGVAVLSDEFIEANYLNEDDLSKKEHQQKAKLSNQQSTPSLNFTSMESNTNNFSIYSLMEEEEEEFSSTQISPIASISNINSSTND